MDPNFFITSTRRWVDNMVIGQGLCPFAAPVQESKRIRYMLSQAASLDELWMAFLSELYLLIESDRSEIETSLLIHPFVLKSFDDYMDFLENANAGLEEVELNGIIQLVGFHPDYCFANSLADAVENYTNRSPYPMIHLLREVSVSEAIVAFPDTRRIPERNMKHLRRLGLEKVKAMLAACFTNKD